MSRIFWDSNLFVYFLEGNDERSAATREIRQKMLERGDQLITSTLTLGEVLVKPVQQRNHALCQLYEDVIGKTALIIPFDAKVARRFAAVRASTSIKGPDAVQLACASQAGVDLFITNDNRLQGKQVEGIQFIVPLDRVPL